MEALSENRVHGLKFCKEDVIDQLSLPFKLRNPQVIEVEMCETIPEDRHCMDASPIKIENGIYRLKVYIKTLREKEGKFCWCMGYSRLSVKDMHYCLEPPTYFTVETVAFHEFLHISGDVCWFGYPDGIIRPNLIGLNAILDLLKST